MTGGGLTGVWYKYCVLHDIIGGQYLVCCGGVYPTRRQGIYQKSWAYYKTQDVGGRPNPFGRLEHHYQTDEVWKGGGIFRIPGYSWTWLPVDVFISKAPREEGLGVVSMVGRAVCGNNVQLPVGLWQVISCENGPNISQVVHISSYDWWISMEGWGVG